MRKFVDKGKQTFRRVVIYYLFENDRSVLRKLTTSKLKSTGIKNLFHNVRKANTVHGVQVAFQVKFDNQYLISAEIFRDGWHIKLQQYAYGDWERPTLEFCEAVFGDAKHNSGWTQETAKVPIIIDQMIKDTREYDVSLQSK